MISHKKKTKGKINRIRTTKKDVLVIHITIFALAVTIFVYPYIVPFLYNTISFWGDPTEQATGVPSAYDGITGDVRRFNYGITHFKSISFYNPSSFIVVYTAFINVLYRPTVLVMFNKITHYKRLLLIDLTVNSVLAIIFIIRAILIWYENYNVLELAYIGI